LEVDEGPLVFVPMGNSATFYPRGNGMIHRYSESLAEDFGIEVEMRNWTVGADNSTAMVDRIRDDEILRSDLAEANVIVFDVPFDAWAQPLMTVSGAPGGDPSGCGGDDGEECLREVLSLYKANVETIFRELTSIADPSETLIRVMDYTLVHVQDLGDTVDMVAPYWVEGQEYVAEVASEYEIPVAKVMERFCGTDCLEDPMEAGLLMEDQEHPTDEGAAIITQMIHDLGYGLPN
jgi:hypothetical protein